MSWVFLRYKYFASIHLPSLLCRLLYTNTLNATSGFVVFKALVRLSSVHWIDIRSVYKNSQPIFLVQNNVFYILILLTFQIPIMLKVLPSRPIFNYSSQFTQSAELHVAWPIKIPGNAKHLKRFPVLPSS